MEVEIKESLYLREGDTFSISEYIDYNLDGADYNIGSVEAATLTASKATEALGRLCDILAEKGIISLEDVVFVARGSRASGETLVEVTSNKQRVLS